MPRVVLVAIVACAGVPAAVVAASGATGAQRTTAPVSACVASSGGALRIVPADRACRDGERRTRWNIAGARGARGASGATGATGAAGSRGAQGPAGATGAVGATGAAGSRGPRGTFDVDTFDGMTCTRGAQAGAITLAYGPQGQVTFTCD